MRTVGLISETLLLLAF
jgi:hypothetical protein